MKKLFLLAALILLSAIPAYSQGVRFGDSDQIIAGQIPGGPLYSVPNAVINFCNSPNVNVPCANKITTYTDATLTTPCSTSTQVVLAGTNSCVGTTDGYGNWGVWVPSGTYTWTVTVPGGATLGPFTATLAAGGSSSSLSINGFPVTNPNLNAVLPTADATFLACSAKVGGSNFIVECPSGTTGSTFLLGNGNAATASALAATPTNCGSNTASTGISANGNAIGCFTPAGTPSGASTAVQFNNSGVFGGVNPPSTPNLPYTLTETPSGGVAQTPVWELPGLGSRNVPGTTSTDTIVASDCDPITRVGYTGSVNVAVTLPTATTLAVPNCSFRIANDTNPAHTVTVTPTTWTISSNGSTGLTSLAITQGQVATFVVDAAGSIWDVDVSNSSGATFSGLTGGTNTTAAMLVGTGGSLGTTGSGTIGATSLVGTVNGNTYPASAGFINNGILFASNTSTVSSNAGLTLNAGTSDQLTVGVPGTTAGTIFLAGKSGVSPFLEFQATGGNSWTVTVPNSLSGNFTFNMPPTQGASGNVLSLTDSSGDTAWNTALLSISCDGLVVACSTTAGAVTQSLASWSTKYSVLNNGTSSSGVPTIVSTPKLLGVTFEGGTSGALTLNMSATGGILNLGSNGTIDGPGNLTVSTYNTNSNCSSSASPAVCGTAAAGSVVIAAGATTVQVNTSAVDSNSQIFVFPDETLGTKLSVTCNTTLATVASGLAITGRTPGTNFTISTTATIATNPVCLSYYIVN